MDGSTPLTATWATGGFDITGIGVLSQASGKYFGMSQVADAAAEAVLTAGWGAAQKGRMWYKADTNEVRYWDGAAKSLGVAGAGLTSINGDTTGAQVITAANDNAQVAPVVSTAAGTSTIKYPMASAAGVNAGLLSKTDYDKFNIAGSFTQGSVIFQGATNLTQDNANFFWDDTNNRLGIGTTAPASQFSMYNPAANGVAADIFQVATAGHPNLFSLKQTGSGQWPLQINVGSGDMNATGGRFVGNWSYWTDLVVLGGVGAIRGADGDSLGRANILLRGGAPTGANIDGGAVSLLGGTGAGTGNGGNINLDGGVAGASGTIGNIILGGTRGNVGIATTAPTAKLHLPAVTNAANTAPLKFSIPGGGAGDLLTAPENGAMEFDGTDYYVTAAGARKKILASTGGTGDFVLKAGDTMTGALTIPAGTEAAPSLNLTGSTTTGLFRAAADTIGFTTNGTEKMRINSAGQIGLQGVQTPAFDIAFPPNVNFGMGAGRMPTNTAAGSFTLQAAGAKSASNPDQNGGDLKLSSGISVGTGISNIRFYTATAGASGNADNAPSEKVTITGSGNVGLGTTAPSALLHVNGTAGTTAMKINGTLDMLDSANNKIINLKDPTATHEAATWDYVNSTVNSAGGNYLRKDGSVALTADWNSGSQKISIGTNAAPANAWLDLAAGTAAVAPLKFHTGANLAAPVNGTMEFDGTNLYFTTAGTRKTIGLSTGGGFVNKTGDTMTGALSIITGPLLDGLNVGVTPGDDVAINSPPIKLQTGYDTAVGGGSQSDSYGGFVLQAIQDSVTTSASHLTIQNYAGADLMVIANTGYVGIGTTAPSRPLEVTNTVADTSTAKFNYTGTSDATNGGGEIIRLTNTDTSATSAGGIQFYGTDSGAAPRHAAAILMAKESNWVGGSGNYPGILSFWTRPAGGNQAERIRISSTGNVGIGTTAPGYKLEVNGTAKIGNTLDMNSTKIINLGTPTAAADAATMAYVDGVSTEYEWLPAASCDKNSGTAYPLYTNVQPGVTPGCNFSGSANSPAYLTYPDAATSYSIVMYDLPDNWNSSKAVDIKFVWGIQSTATNSVVWTVATKCIGEDQAGIASSAGYNAVQNIAFSQATTNANKYTSTQSNMTMTGCAPGETLLLRVGRDALHASDTFAGNIYLFGVRLTIRK